MTDSSGDRREQIRSFLSRYRPPGGARRGSEWSDEDVERLERAMSRPHHIHHPDPRNPERCEQCGTPVRRG